MTEGRGVFIDDRGVKAGWKEEADESPKLTSELPS